MSEPFLPPLKSLRTFIIYIVPQWGAFVLIYSNSDLLSLHVIMKSFFNPDGFNLSITGVALDLAGATEGELGRITVYAQLGVILGDAPVL